MRVADINLCWEAESRVKEFSCFPRRIYWGKGGERGGASISKLHSKRKEHLFRSSSKRKFNRSTLLLE